MHHGLSDCGCGEDTCSAMPPEFVRVRYFYGQRLGVMELNDEAAYHQSKHAFHNARLHGAGVLCGLRAERFVMVPGSASTVLRVIRGAAIDGCGREIIVGVDQCIDVAAWFARNRQRLPSFAAGATKHLHVCLRYRECPTDPSPAPRDPCGCGTGSCEYGRVREGFDLSLLTDEEKEALEETTFPPTASLLAALDALGPAGSAGATTAALEERIATLVSADCPVSVEDTCLCLASFDVVLDNTPVPVDITDPDNAILERRSLLSTSALQSMAFALAVNGADAGLLGAGPRVGPLTFTPAGPDGGTLELPVVLATAGTPPADVPLVAASVDLAIVRLSRLDPANGWKNVTPPASDIAFQMGPPPRFTLKFANGLLPAVRYLLTFETDSGAPIVDTSGRPLRPKRLARMFAFVQDPATSTLKLDPLV